MHVRRGMATLPDWTERSLIRLEKDWLRLRGLLCPSWKSRFNMIVPGEIKEEIYTGFWTNTSTLAFHHLQAGIELMAAGHAPDTIRFNHRFVSPDAHATTIRTSCQVQHFVLEVFIAGAT